MKELSVYLNHYSCKDFVGTLAMNNRRLFFEYDVNFLNRSIHISPYSLPLQPGLKEFKNFNFFDLFGAFSDSLPDGWGLLLMDKNLQTRNINHRGLSSFDRLAYIGSNAMGALEYQPSSSPDSIEASELNLHLLAKNAIDIYEGSSEDVLDLLFRVGGSPGGARPKIELIETIDGNFKASDPSILDTDVHWLVKFDVSKEFQNFSRVEYFFSIMAKNCGVAMMETRLFLDREGKDHFAIKRFDRQGKSKIHTHTFGSLIESNFRIPDQDYRNLMLITFDLTKDIKDVYRIFRLMVFNHLTTNQDDHVKNFSFILDQNFSWSFAPAYDLTPCFGMNNWHSMTINNKGVNIEDADYIAATKGLGVDKQQLHLIIEEVKTGVLKSHLDSSLLLKKDFNLLKRDYLKLK